MGGKIIHLLYLLLLLLLVRLVVIMFFVSTFLVLLIIADWMFDIKMGVSYLGKYTLLESKLTQRVLNISFGNIIGILIGLLIWLIYVGIQRYSYFNSL